ncbi:LysR family transcriptional regulator [Alloyangia pacifica]|uniref:DNA-binding transcriptional regulator, LysR family n=1 Tax=Alloyangia pacifica TaxID=311180 RepID=A0A1I6QH81_9RHOB|nr:LysR family transcriptional regulator [Alloyangia pacifica]SDF89944.1 DNA-binding transcriptional regulator, LysR family [Alloyangia pacifica]SFS51833.1 DNA-binding transcriptional regulator, LysR family [Alloyangia pacifica]
MIDPQQLDFRSFHVLSVVHRERSFSRAAEVLGTSQSMVSYAIEKLRKVFDDPLFVREAGRTLPTPRCEEVVAYAVDLIAGFDTIRARPAFDPATAGDRVTIACNYYERSFMIPPIITNLRREAPRLQIEVVDASGQGHQRLLDGEADLLIGPYRRQDASFYERMVLTDRYACLMDSAHPAAGRTPTLQQYLDFEHIFITYGGRWVSPYVSEIEAAGHSLSVALRVPSPAGIDRLVAGSDLVATVPRRLAILQDPSLAIVDCPVVSTIEVKMVWSARTHQSAVMRWVRDLVSRTIAGLA